MSAPNTPPAWRRAFLRELARGCSVRRAAQIAGISEGSAYARRKRDPAFATSWDRALADARARLADDGAPPVPALRDDEIVRWSKSGKPCVTRAGPGRWSVAKERAFLEELAATANVKAAARKAGICAQSIYTRRRQWPGFAAAWDAAKAEGYSRLEMLLLCQATATLDPDPELSPRETPAMTVDQAMNLLKLHRASVQGGTRQRYGWRQREPDIEEVRADILRKVAAMDRARAARAARG